jgi:D-citramalate synthase
MRIEIMDTTLRDGEQTTGVSFNAQEKLNIARILLEEVGVDRIEVASARVSAGELEGVKKIVEWAEPRGLLERIEVLGFIDGNASVDWIHPRDKSGTCWLKDHCGAGNNCIRH